MLEIKKETHKMILIGDSMVGKTGLFTQLVEGKFNNQYKATIGSVFANIEHQRDGAKFDVQLWDTAGQERFKSLAVTKARTYLSLFILSMTRAALTM